MPVQCTCLSCGALFSVFPHEIRRGRGQYCSRSCKAEGQRGPRTDLIERFWAKVDTFGGPDACWPWTASRHGYGYGQLGLPGGKRNIYAHRLAWEIANGPIPDGKDILHSCDNPPCCNARHLHPGTNLENAQEAKARHRYASGDRHPWHTKPEVYKGFRDHLDFSGARGPSAKLTEDQVLDIRRTHQPYRVTNRALAEKYHVSIPTIARIIAGKTWKSSGTQ